MVMCIALLVLCLHACACAKTQEPNIPFHQNLLMPIVKHGGGGVMIWDCFVDTRPGNVVITESTLNSSVYQNILEANERPSVCDS